MDIKTRHWVVALVFATAFHVVGVSLFGVPQSRLSVPNKVATSVVIELGDENAVPMQQPSTGPLPDTAVDLVEEAAEVDTSRTDVIRESSPETLVAELAPVDQVDTPPEEVRPQLRSAPLPEVVDLAAVTRKLETVQPVTSLPTPVRSTIRQSLLDTGPATTPAIDLVEPGTATELGTPATASEPPPAPLPNVGDETAEISSQPLPAEYVAGESPVLLPRSVEARRPRESRLPEAVEPKLRPALQDPLSPEAPVAPVPLPGIVLDMAAVSPAAKARTAVPAPVPFEESLPREVPQTAVVQFRLAPAVTETARLPAESSPQLAPTVAPAESGRARPPEQSVTMREGTTGVTAEYQGLLTAWLQKHMRYPWEARINGYQGTAVLRFTIRRDGSVASSLLERSSGHDVLDREAQDILRRAEPFPRIPAEMLGSELEVRVPVRFYWKEFLRQREVPTIYLE